ncbi:RluA family pseudouridine synthase [Oceanobacillus massiliensis]|uniref:RluA family pseudouridine synthase n=1 Tax=Oceanobacillus massiliensis TaxID=1465765 RepID=UPI000289791C|nr:RluA family pseudouridine synthase [Oceanobacillus massiliensis]
MDIVYEDEAVIVINKPPGMATMPSPQHFTGTLANGLIAYYRSCGRNDSTVHVVTRLDANTSGLVLIAKDRYTHSLFSEAQKAAKINRKYMAVVEGVPQTKGTIDAPIARKAGSIIEREVNDSGRRAVTHYKKLQELAGHSLVEVELETGRTHQIRVHFSNEGYPLAGDDLYGGTLQLMGRQALHCFDLNFRHPLTKRAIHLQVELPEDMKLLLQGIELKKNV